MSKKPEDYSPLIENLSKLKRKKDSRIVDVAKILGLKYQDVILKKSVSEEEEENKEELRAPEKEEEK